MAELLIVTSNDIPGYKITEVYGEVFGLATRSRHIGSNIGQGLKTVVGGEIQGYTKLQRETRDHAIERLIEATEAKGGNAVIAMRFDSSTFQNIDSVAAYGTAVRIEKG
ncbi:heavy metal-binding domain-containing protein [Lactococcus termiticola]|uniref:UPF0145 protein NtB2_00869 n=1 Tax=Lactococcus termiticola TaxID=2169526 RepID=A0A2R5HHC1_9LACT|nr:heavy metal-binding domain-containing protein [Lactococcus termiticola]GBG96745.1 hypothetical protein NtB2_00869 [Lactococcus termiticola]